MCKDMKGFSLVALLSFGAKAFVKITNTDGKGGFLSAVSRNARIPSKISQVVDCDDVVLKLNRWESYISKRKGYYPKVSTESIILARRFIRESETPFLMEWQHMVPALKSDLSKDVFYYKEKSYKNMTSHLCLGDMSIPKKKYFIRGIVENPENVLYEFSIHGFLHRLQKNAYKSSSPVRIDISKLKDWCHGIYHFSLTRSFEKKS